MGSRFMHLLIADYVATELRVEERGRMLLGSLAPDASNAKLDTHFQGSSFLHSPGASWDYGKFVIKYWDRMSDPFMLGYLTHLVADEVWAMKSYFSGFTEMLQRDPTLYDRYHGDFRCAGLSRALPAGEIPTREKGTSRPTRNRVLDLRR